MRGLLSDYIKDGAAGYHSPLPWIRCSKKHGRDCWAAFRNKLAPSQPTCAAPSAVSWLNVQSSNKLSVYPSVMPHLVHTYAIGIQGICKPAPDTRMCNTERV